MKKAQLNRLELLKYKFIPRLQVCGINEPWGEQHESYRFYVEHGPAATGCSWEEYFIKQQKAGFQPKDLTYQDHMESLGQW